MSAYSNAIDKVCGKRAAVLHRELSSDEIEEVEDRLLQSWIDARRFDELIEYAMEEFELQGGEAFCASLGNALCKTKNGNLAQQLFEGLANARESAFWRVWPKAQLGQIGAMKEASVHLANAMKALSELYRCYAALENEAGKHQVQAVMLRLQGHKQSEA